MNHTLVGQVTVDRARNTARYVGECPVCGVEVTATVSPARDAANLTQVLTAAHEAQGNAPTIAASLAPALRRLLRECDREEVYTGARDPDLAVRIDGSRVDPELIRALLTHGLIHTMPALVGTVHSWRPTMLGRAVLRHLEGS